MEVGADLAHTSWRDDLWVQAFGLSPLNVLDYFALSPFYDRTCLNEQAKLKGLTPKQLACVLPESCSSWGLVGWVEGASERVSNGSRAHRTDTSPIILPSQYTGSGDRVRPEGCAASPSLCHQPPAPALARGAGDASGLFLRAGWYRLPGSEPLHRHQQSIGEGRGKGYGSWM